MSASPVIVSPILYMGNKSRLIRRGLINLFPDCINTFVDVFAGSATVAMNTTANNYILNDIDETLQEYYAMFSKFNDKYIIEHIKLRIAEFNLPQKTTIRCFSDKDEVEIYKQAYHRFRDSYNKHKNTLDLYTLMFFAFSQQFRVNQKGDFNMPFGNNCFSAQNEKNIINGCNFFSQSNVKIQKQDFVALLEQIIFNNDDFVYFDSPYSITTATYNENAKWGVDDDFRLFEMCKILHNKGIKFGISNVLFNKGIENVILRDFCKDNGFYVFSPNNFQYHACGKENKKQQEVFVCNYKPFETKSNFSQVVL
ncbi:Dam family site-specific DNA-(adenine-N6)-methyltransferase [Campylobacter sp. JMF_01 NE2]|uniref:Dam family site-specific DNA-(adenine-N6)-methyltransferase n=1 Tax=unclassified Campylobacter TaxID=2593542 RepID=UPI0022E9C32A|nr:MULTISPECIES: Dam family site-specific DNA-(adenine-N6)-methyltransferase [unclassified Campylobacter]MDA3053337.1 Dam family site-specific DNA-(adenine-N6)-methyltransferase [Campylobacter sp. JMF_03 NE3]MDA3067643.1 Dam family site-specific DNA-(adenine-N6)-methyltransferase [Campylobacter sp. JMF_01 NE2]